MTHISGKKTFLLVLSALLLLTGFQLWAAGGNESPGSDDRPAVTVGSKIDTEGALLGNIIVLLLQDAGIPVIDRTQTGATSVVREAIISGEIDIYPEYTGNGYYLFSGMSEADVWKNASTAYETVRQLDAEAHNIIWLTPAPANNTWAIAVLAELAEAQGLVTLEDLASYINAGGDFKLAGSEEFVSSDAALPAFEQGYGFSLNDDQLLVFSSGNTAVTEQAASRGTDGVNAAMAYGTDGQLAALNLVVMTDTLGIQPVYEPAPIIRGETLELYPEITAILQPVFESLTLELLQELNGRIAVNGESAAAVARSYLSDRGYID